ncbi:ABC transporter substrate-binding protein [Bifidobacterium aquikefiri]|uniref:Peptide-binding protein n=1 Tax=Bifidobacterium aquikefiri TaxID=1653207 RepID=A0A261GAX5_9BIFI|nr:ABC transporter substrate-binding protein [Bifidobacterium aquikefiri]OZG68393.1 peptide-binding protein [Bifidobacterium aquikefiri]
MKWRIKGAVAVLAAASMIFAVAACGSGSSASTSRPLTFGKPDGPQTNNSNPFLGTSAASVQGYRYAIYETLVQINDVKPTEKPVPWLATKWSWNSDYTSVTFTIRKGVKWTDGKPLTAADVAFTFNLVKNNPALNTGSIPFKDVTRSGDDVTVTFTENQYVHMSSLYQQFIVPEHIWKSVGDPSKYLDKNPVGTGPYILKTWSTQGVTLTSNPNYWKGKLNVATIRYIEYNDNTALTSAMTSGQVDHGFVYIANYKTAWLSKNSANKAWYPSTLGNTTLFINNAKGAFSNIAFRKAASMIIDRSALSKQGTTGAANPITSVTGLPSSGKSFIDSAYSGQTFKVDASGAKAILTQAGYTGVGSSNGLKDSTGQAVTVTLTDPSGWSDYDTELQLIGSELQSLGAKVTVQNPSYDTWNEQIAKGNFDGALHWTDSGFTPYNIYLDSMGGTFYKPIGTDANYNFGRFQNAQADAAIKDYAAATTDAQRTKDLATLQKIYVEQVPVIPVLEVPVWGNYTSRSYTGWPSESNPYSNINMTTPAETLVLTKLKPVK